MMIRYAQRSVALVCLGLAAVTANAAVPPDIEAGLMKIGPIVDPACTAKLYRPLMPANDITSDAKPLYPGVTIERDLSFGPDAKDVVDVFVGDKGSSSRTVLIYVPGGSGEKIELQDREANAFYDNIGRWAARHDMVGVNMQRHFGAAWDDGAKDISRMIAFLQANVGKYHGNPDRMIIWAHSAGNMPLGTYVGRPELWGPRGVGVKGIIFMSPAAFNILPLKVDMGSFQDMMKMFALGGKTCGEGGPMSTAATLPGRTAGQAGGPPGHVMGAPGAAPPPGPPGSPGAAPPGPPGGPPPDAAALLGRSSLPALKSTTAKIMLANAEMDPGAAANEGKFLPFVTTLHDELCKEGASHCPTLFLARGHSHISEVFSIDTPDTSVSGPILTWIKKIP